MRWNEKIAHMRRGAEIIQEKLAGSVSPDDLGVAAVNAEDIARVARGIIDGSADPAHDEEDADAG